MCTLATANPKWQKTNVRSQKGERRWTCIRKCEQRERAEETLCTKAMPSQRFILLLWQISIEHAPCVIQLHPRVSSKGDGKVGSRSADGQLACGFPSMMAVRLPPFALIPSLVHCVLTSLPTLPFWPMKVQVPVTLRSRHALPRTHTPAYGGPGGGGDGCGCGGPGAGGRGPVSATQL